MNCQGAFCNINFRKGLAGNLAKNGGIVARGGLLYCRMDVVVFSGLISLNVIT